MIFVQGRASCWGFRWLDVCKPGLYVVTVVAHGFDAANFDATVDDFGNLVRVQ